MAYSTYALFADSNDANRAAKEMKAQETERDKIKLKVHRSLEGRPNSELAMFETGAASTAAKVGLAGAAIGVVLGLIAMGPAGLVGAGAFTLVVFGGVTGAVLGILIGVIVGASDADPGMKDLFAKMQPGMTLLGIDSSSPQAAECVDRILAKYEVQVVRRNLVTKANEVKDSNVEALPPSH